VSAQRSYLDWNATAPLRPEARLAMLAALEETGNPSSVHAEGRRARAIVERARDQIAALVGAEPHNVIFTSGATEAATMALTPQWSGAHPIATFLVSAIEHPCVLAGGQFDASATFPVAVTASGVVDFVFLKQLLDLKESTVGAPLLALMLANNETGVIQPAAAAATLVHGAGGYLICDAVQAAGRIPIDLKSLGADALLLSAHKLGGPKGVGALVLAHEARAPMPLIRGGGQERGHRAGTENVAAIAGFGAAAKAAQADLVNMPRIARLRDRLEQAISIRKSARLLSNLLDIHGNEQRSSLNLSSPLQAELPGRLANTTLISLPGARAESLVIQLDLAGIAVSAGSACSSGKVKRSHVLDAMGVDPVIAEGTIRVSLGPTTTEADVDRFLSAWAEIAARHSGRAKHPEGGATL